MYRNSFTGTDFVDLLLRRQLVESREAAVELGVTLIHMQLAYHVVWKYDFQDSTLCYRQ